MGELLVQTWRCSKDASTENMNIDESCNAMSLASALPKLLDQMSCFEAMMWSCHSLNILNIRVLALDLFRTSSSKMLSAAPAAS